MKKLFTIIALFVSVIVLSSSCTKSDIRLQGYVGTVEKKIITLTPDVTVKIKKSKKTMEVQTDLVGLFMFEKLAPGTWEITVSKEGYETQTKKVALSGGSSGNIFHENFIMEKKSSPK